MLLIILIGAALSYARPEPSTWPASVCAERLRQSPRRIDRGTSIGAPIGLALGVPPRTTRYRVPAHKPAPSSPPHQSAVADQRQQLTYYRLRRRARTGNPAAGLTTADKEISMDNIELLQQELEGAYQAAYAAPQGTSDWQPVNAAREKLNAAIEAAKTPEQRQIEALNVQIGLLERKVARLDASLEGARKNNEQLRTVIGAHTGKPTNKAIGLLAMDLWSIRQSEDTLAKFVRAGDIEGALRVCINRGLPRAPAANLSEQVDRIGLPRMQA